MKATNFPFAAGVLLALAFTFSCSAPPEEGYSTTPPGSCDIGDYRTVEIGEQRWMAENLNCAVSGSKCYAYEPANCAKYGRLYDWETARNICPSGWHLPSKEEWEKLFDYVKNEKCERDWFGLTDCEAKHLKASSGWESNGNGTDDYGFSALPGGGADEYSFGGLIGGGAWGVLGSEGNWWASEYDSDEAWYIHFSSYSDITFLSRSNKNHLLSIRCVQGL